MSKLIILTLLIVGIFTVGSLATNEAYAATDMFLKIEGIDGEANDEGEIKINESLQWGLTNQDKKRGGGGKVTIQDLSFVMKFEKASPKLMQAVADGKQFPKAVITLENSKHGETYLIITLTEVLISSYETEASTQEGQFDKVSLNFGKILFEYHQLDDKGIPIDVPVVAGSASKHGR